MPAVPPPTHWPLVQLWPAPHALVHEPQCAVVVTSVHAPLHTIWLLEAQAQLPLTQLVPPLQTVQLFPQCAESLFALHAPSEHFMVPVGHDPEQALLTQTCALVQAVQLVPQCCTLDATHEPPQETRPDAHEHEPF